MTKLELALDIICSNIENEYDDFKHYSMVDRDKYRAWHTMYKLKNFATVLECLLENVKENLPILDETKRCLNIAKNIECNYDIYWGEGE